MTDLDPLLAEHYETVLARNPGEQEFHQAVLEVLSTLGPVVRKHREYVDAAIIDVHCEASSEKMALGHMSDGRASLVVGSHSHIPTADAQIFNRGTAYQTDAGACADYDSVIGMDKFEPLQRFTKKMPTGRMSPATGPATLCAVFVETAPRTGLAVRCEPVRIGGRLKPSVPEA